MDRLAAELFVECLEAEGQDSMSLPSFGLDFRNPDFVAYAGSYGARGYRVGEAADLPRLLKRAMGEDGVSVIDCPADYSENVRVLTEELEARTAAL